MPDLGAYGTYVLASYGVAIAVLLLVIGVSLRSAARAKAELARLEARHGRRRPADSPPGFDNPEDPAP